MKRNRLIIPDSYSYNLLLQARLLPLTNKSTGREVQKEQKDEGDPITQSLELLQEMKKGRPKARPNVYTYNIILNGLAAVAGRDSNAANTSRELLKEMKSNDRHTAPDPVTYGTVMKVLLNVAKATGDLSLVNETVELFEEMKQNCESLPGVVAYGALLSGLTLKMQNGDENAAVVAMDLLKGMRPPPAPAEPAAPKPLLIPTAKDTSITSPLNGINPRVRRKADDDEGAPGPLVADIVLYRIVMTGLSGLVQAGSLTGGKLMAELLDRMRAENVYPDVVVYSTTMHALLSQTNGKDTTAAERSLDLFDEMRIAAAEKQAPCRPDLRTYNIALAALYRIAKAGDTSSGTRCLAIVNEMKSFKRLQPDVVTYSSAIKVLAKVAASRKDTNDLDKCLALYTELLGKTEMDSKAATSAVFEMLGQR